MLFLQSKSSRNVKYKDYFMDEDPTQNESDEEGESAPDEEEEEEEDDEDMDGADYEQYVYIFLFFLKTLYCFTTLEGQRDSFAPCRSDSEIRNARDALRKVTFDLPSESEGEDVQDILGGKTKNLTKPDTKSGFEKRQEKVRPVRSSRCLVCVCVVLLHWSYRVYVTNKYRTSHRKLFHFVNMNIQIISDVHRHAKVVYCHLKT